MHEIVTKACSTCPDQKEAGVVLQLIHGIRQGSYPVLKSYFFAHAFEYHVVTKRSQDGVGDLVLTDGDDHYMVCEAKYLNFEATGRTACARRRMQRKRCREQVKARLSQHFKQGNFLNPMGFALWNNKDGQLHVEFIGCICNGKFCAANCEEDETHYSNDDHLNDENNDPDDQLDLTKRQHIEVMEEIEEMANSADSMHKDAHVALRVIHAIQNGSCPLAISSFRFVHKFTCHLIEAPQSHLGTCDLIHTDGDGCYATCAAKFLDFRSTSQNARRRRTKQRNHAISRSHERVSQLVKEGSILKALSIVVSNKDSRSDGPLHYEQCDEVMIDGKLYMIGSPDRVGDREEYAQSFEGYSSSDPEKWEAAMMYIRAGF